ncbi:hypothetical protein PORY_002436, partial [Pneumocystis oryctolagi]
MLSKKIGISELFTRNSSGIFEKLELKLIKACQELKKENNVNFLNVELLSLCLRTTKTAFMLSSYLQFKGIFLQESLNKKRDFSSEDCEILEEKCEMLKQNLVKVKELCYALKRNCKRLKGANQLEKKCAKSIVKKDLEDNIMIQFVGYLTGETTCNITLRCYYSLLNETFNSSFKTLCDDSNNSNVYMKRLNKKKRILLIGNSNIKEFKLTTDTKTKVKKAIKELLAFEKSSNVFNLYLDLKKQCYKLRDNSLLRKEFLTWEKVYSTIDTTITSISQQCKATECTTKDETGQGMVKEIVIGVIVWAQSDGIGEEELLALILKEGNLQEQQCKDKLKEYCDGLSKASKNPEDVHEKLKGLCENKKYETKCNTLKTQVQDKCNKFKKELETALGTLKDDECAKNERQCLFLEGADPTNLKDNCNKLRNDCYQRKRDGVAVEALLRALGDGSLQEESTCKPKLKKVCQELSGESDELAIHCLNDNMCTSLVNSAKEKCTALKDAIKNEQDITNETCPSLLEQCYFYGPNCKEGSDKPNCTLVEEKCSGQGVTFVPPDQPFIPTHRPTTLAQKIGLSALYKRAAQDGVHIASPPDQDLDFLALLKQSSGVGNNNIKQKCDDMLSSKCQKPEDYPMLKGLCENNKENGTKKCEA